MKKTLKLYIAFVVISAGALMSALLFLNYQVEPLWVVLIWGISSWISDMFPVEVKKINGNSMLLGLSMTFNLSAAVLFSPLTAALIGMIGGLPSLKKTEWSKAIFNVAQISISTAMASLIYRWTYPVNSAEIIKILAIGIAILSYAVLNNIFVSSAVSLATGKKMKTILKDVFMDFFGISIFISLAVAYVVVYLYPYVGLWDIAIALGPLLTIRFVLDLYKKFLNTKIESMGALLKALEEKDPYTAGHGERVSKYATLVAERLGIDGKLLEDLRMAAWLHDIGKIGIRDKVLNKPGKLSLDEFEEIKSHPVKGAEILSEVPSFRKMVPWVKYHHEHWDGSGYPEGLKGKQIPLEARIIGVVDVYDALTTQRAYRKAFSPEMALQIMKNESGKSFDPVVLAAFLDVIDNIEDVRNGRDVKEE
ncbi:HD-GYP domain-containing protein [Mesoaciditoga lauensis]|uniref:HD-GYP domain-containing protein n=1 Tax=Mesoaciditoga lauensis TaxID=1495039 RepID=UPI00056843FE|nr:HD-GYP domain-containing protein [Mesoaciditoga lauensis]